MIAISFIIPTYNTLELTRRCVETLIETVDLSEHEVLLIDDGSTDGTVEYLATLPPVFKTITNSVNQGYSKNCNLAARHARGKILSVLHHVSASPGRKAWEDQNLHQFLESWRHETVWISIRECITWEILEMILHLPPFWRSIIYAQPFIRYF